MDKERVDSIHEAIMRLSGPVSVPASGAERIFWWDCAVQAMSALLSGSSSREGGNLMAIEPAIVARYAYDYADAMLAEGRNRDGK